MYHLTARKILYWSLTAKLDIYNKSLPSTIYNVTVLWSISLLCMISFKCKTLNYKLVHLNILSILYSVFFES